MSIDLKALRKVIDAGEPDSKVMVSRRWLAEVHRVVSEGQRFKQATEALVGSDKSIMESVFGGNWRGRK